MRLSASCPVVQNSARPVEGVPGRPLRRLELWAFEDDSWVFIRSYLILAASGHAGPKLREGDRQVPEGTYRIESLNPNSSYHLSMKLEYPNDYDLEKARGEGRINLGGDIFIHGKAVSIGCLAIGDEAIEELFCLVGSQWPTEVKVLIAPNDLRRRQAAERSGSAPAWTDELYEGLRRDLEPFSMRPATDSAGSRRSVAAIPPPAQAGRIAAAPPGASAGGGWAWLGASVLWIDGLPPAQAARCRQAARRQRGGGAATQLRT